MAENEFQKASPDEMLNDEQRIKSEEKELSPDNIALAKVVYLGGGSSYWSKAEVGFHELATTDTWYGDKLTAGLLYAEQVLSQGVLPYDLAKRAGIERSSFGHSPDDPALSFTGSNIVSLYPASRYLDTQGFHHSNHVMDMESHELAFLCRYKVDEENQHSYEYMGEVAVKGRIKPRDIIGIAVSSRYLDMNFWAGVSGNSDEEYYNQVKRVAKELNLPEQDPEREDWDYEEFQRLVIKAMGYENIETVGDYLKHLGKKYSIPIYTDDEGRGLALFWPKRIPSDEMGQFPKP